MFLEALEITHIPETEAARHLVFAALLQLFMIYVWIL